MEYLCNIFTQIEQFMFTDIVAQMSYFENINYAFCE